MENKNQNAINNPDGNAIYGEQINRPTWVDENFDLMDMLTEQDYYFPTNRSIFDVIGPSSSVLLPQALEPQSFELAPAAGVTSEIVNTPAIPTPENSSRISRSSNDTATEDQVSKQIGEDGYGKVDKNKKL